MPDELAVLQDRCERGCNNPAQEPHECPFNSEINDDYSLCNCCDACSQQCSDDI